MLIRLPLLAVFCFLGCYFTSVLLYPGGSQVSLTSIGFDWVNNYWCDLMSEYAYNDMPNPGRLPALLGMLFLCVGVGALFYLFPNYYQLSKTWSTIIRYMGIVAMGLAFFIFTPIHDPMLIASCLLSIPPLIGIFVGLKKNKKTILFYFGLFCIALMGLNNVMYYAKIGIEGLPWVQKITFAIVLCWFISINFSFFKVKPIE